MQADRSARKGERGMIMIPMAIAIVGLGGAGSLAIDSGSALVTESKLQNVANPDSQIQLTRALGINQIAITADSTAAISAMGTVKARKGEFPVGLEENSFSTQDCSTNETMKFFPTQPTNWVGDAGRDN